MSIVASAMKALNRHVERVFDPSRKERHWIGRKLKKGTDDRRRFDHATHAAGRARQRGHGALIQAGRAALLLLFPALAGGLPLRS